MAKNEIRLYSDTVFRLPHPVDTSDPENPVPIDSVTSSDIWMMYARRMSLVTQDVTPGASVVVGVEDVTPFAQGDLVTFHALQSPPTVEREHPTVTNVPADDGHLVLDNVTGTIVAGQRIHVAVSDTAIDGSTLYGPTPTATGKDWGWTGSLNPAQMGPLAYGDRILVEWDLYSLASLRFRQELECVVVP